MQKLGFQKLPAENQEIEERDENRPADGVAYRHKEKILRKRRCGERGESSAVQHHAQRDEKHICDAVLEPHRDESGDRKQSRNELAGRILRAEGYPHGEADEPVAEHAADEHLSGGSDDFIAARESAAAPHFSEISPLAKMSAAKNRAPAKFAK